MLNNGGTWKRRTCPQINDRPITKTTFNIRMTKHADIYFTFQTFRHDDKQKVKVSNF